mgnify:CR=1 FL=1
MNAGLDAVPTFVITPVIVTVSDVVGLDGVTVIDVASRSGCPDVLKTAPTLFAALIETEQEPVPLHAPDQPAKAEPDAALAVSVTVVPDVKLAEHVEPQLIPVGLDVTVPLPVPDFVTVRA